MHYRRIRFGQIGSHKAVDFAICELRRYLKQMDPELTIDVLQFSAVNPTKQNLIWVGCDPVFAPQLPAVEDTLLDDSISICVENNCGHITGTNERSVLIAAYRFLRELGCVWFRPGAEGVMFLPTLMGFSVPGYITDLIQMVPYLVTIAVLVITSLRKKREDQPPASLGLAYFREER